jgi:cytochrome b6-f complex iron-sulfur subunit
MDRKEFLSLVGLSGGSLLMACIGCSKSVNGGITGPPSVDFTIDITQSPNTALQTNGGYIYNSGVIVARTLTGSFIAVQQTCTHESVSVVYQGSKQRFYCDGHGATFTEAGVVTGGPAPKALKTYNTSLNGNVLHVYS